MRESRNADEQHKKTEASTVQTDNALDALKPPPRRHGALSGIVVTCPQIAGRIRYFDHPLFHLPDAWQRILNDPEGQLPSPLPLSQRGSDRFSNLLIYPPPTPEQITKLFLRMNFLKFSAAHIIEATAPLSLSDEQLRTVRENLTRAKETKDALVAINMRLAVQVANRFSRSPHIVEDLVSFGSEILMRASESFDCSRPYPFYAYAKRSLVSNYSKLNKTGRVFEAATLPSDTLFHDLEDVRTNELQESKNSLLLSRSIEAIFNELDERERIALHMRSLEEATFVEIGARLGITKQGAQGIVNRAIRRLQQRAGTDPRDSLL